jgi:pyruvate/2-oxoglutarate dehydrogenase complex dihydrolipoamide dehydrogenase (E3) component
MARKFDAIIIGTGQAGPSLAGRLTAAGVKTAVIERKQFGGTCVNTGCTPTKALVASARAAHMARRGPDFGVSPVGKVAMDMKKVKRRKDEIVRNSNEGLGSWLESMENATVFHGHGRFEGPRTVRVGEELLEAGRIFINVGGRASVPPVAGLDSVPYLNNSSIMEVDFLPEHLLILGGGYIALEFGQIYRRFGSEVTIVQRGERLLTQEDDDIATAVHEILENEGIQICTNTGDYQVENRSGKVAMQMKCRGASRDVIGSHLLVATGRRPNTDDLGLDKAGVKTDKRGIIEVDDQLRTSVEGIWALGECNGKGAFTHTSYNDYEIVAANLLDNDRRRVSDRITTYALYIDPPLGRAGMTERQVRESGRKALIATRPMTRVARAVEKGETQGFMKALVDAETKRILGAAILGVGGDEAIHSILDVMYADAPYTVIQRAVHIHPTVTELIPTMLADLKPLN